MIKKFARVVTRLLRFKPRIILAMDGGICSQMHFYLVGKVLEQQGNRVVYDLSWFKKNGKDLDGKHARNFDLLKLFPNLVLKSNIPYILRRLYISGHYRWNDYFDKAANPTAWQSLKAPLYLAGYFHDSDDMFGELFRNTFVRVGYIGELDHLRALEEMAMGYTPCAIHIRRGDLSGYNPAYGSPPDLEYFRQAVETIKKEEGQEVAFYIFSDDPEWCRKNVVPHLPEAHIRVMDINGPEEGYLDLWMMSYCKHHITSQGSMGKYAALLRDEKISDGMVILPPNETSREWLGRFKSGMILDPKTPTT